MKYDVSFRPTDASRLNFVWFVFGADGKTIRDGFVSKRDALAWAFRELGLNG